MHYVKVVDGKITEGPFELSGSPTASPSAHWGQEQMKLNNYRFVNLAHDETIEEIDYAHPMIGEYEVNYPRKMKAESAALVYVKEAKIKELRAACYDLLQKRYSLQDQLIALVDPRPGAAEVRLKIRTFWDVCMNAFSLVNSAQSKQEIEDVNPAWPVI